MSVREAAQALLDALKRVHVYADSGKAQDAYLDARDALEQALAEARE